LSRRHCSRFSNAKGDILALCQSGQRRADLAGRFGVNKSTIRRWLAEARPPAEGWECPINRKCSETNPHEHCRRCGVILNPAGPDEYRPAAAGLCRWCVQDTERYPDSSEEAA